MSNRSERQAVEKPLANFAKEKLRLFHSVPREVVQDIDSTLDLQAKDDPFWKRFLGE